MVRLGRIFNILLQLADPFVRSNETTHIYDLEHGASSSV
jgi:hypothetical protein